MQNKTRLQVALLRIGEGLGHDIRLDYSGAARLELQSDVFISIEQPIDSPFVFLYATVCDLTKADRTLYLDFALRRNFFKIDVAHAWLSLDAETDELVLCGMKDDEQIDEESLTEHILEMWSETLRIRDVISAEIIKRSRSEFESEGPTSAD